MTVLAQVADSLTGLIVGQLEPIEWEATDPLRGPGTGSITLRRPTDSGQVKMYRNLLTPRRRMIMLEDDHGPFFGGPIPRRADVNGQTLVVPLVDWRSWFYRTPIRPNLTTLKAQDYIKNKAHRTEQSKIMTDLAAKALAVATKPRMVIDPAPTTGIKREITALTLEKGIGEYLDSIMDLDKGCEWWTYMAYDPDNSEKLLAHFAVAYPERKHAGRAPILLQYDLDGGTINGYDPGNSDDYSNTVWAVGNGSTKKWHYATTAAIRRGSDLTWETTTQTDATTTAGAQAAAAGFIKGEAVLGSITVDVDAERFRFATIGPGDRARVEIHDLWNDITVAAARITQRVMSGGAGKATMQRFTIDLDDNKPIDQSVVPGSKA